MRDGHGALVHVGHQGLQNVHVNVVQNQHRVSAGVVLNKGFHLDNSSNAFNEREC